jgi:hypothetical protein
MMLVPAWPSAKSVTVPDGVLVFDFDYSGLVLVLENNASFIS